jgi:hypothetical protein
MEEKMTMSEKKTKSAAFVIAVSVICLAVIAYFLFTTIDNTGYESSQVSQMQELTRQVRGKESDVKKKEGELAQLTTRLHEKTGANTPLNLDTMELNSKEREVLEQQIAQEKDVSIRSLLKEILEKKDDIKLLKQEIAAIEKLLPTPHIAKKGESHYQIALDFLVQKQGVEEERAVQILARTALFDQLAEGFKVWNFYTGDEYGTSITQGEADVSPNVFVHRAKKELMDARDNAVAQRDKLAEGIEALEENQEVIAARLDQTTREKQELNSRVNLLDKQVNSMFYRMDSRKNLKKKGILKGGFLSADRLKDSAPQHFNRSLDLTVEDSLVISAAELGIDKIKNVVLYPRFHKKGASYKVLITPDKKHALLTLLDKEKFKSERVVIAVHRQPNIPVKYRRGR